MSRKKTESSRFPAWLKPWLFPLAVACLYGIGLVWSPESTDRAFAVSVSMLRQLAFPLCLAFAMMVLLNRFVSPASVSRFLGQSAGLKGVVLSALAGILSMGPIYAWYPFFKTLREKGAAPFFLATFISCRSIKPVLFPVMLSAFGLRFSLLYVAVSLVGALMIAGAVSLVCLDSFSPTDSEK